MLVHWVICGDHRGEMDCIGNVTFYIDTGLTLHPSNPTPRRFHSGQRVCSLPLTSTWGCHRELVLISHSKDT
jgi:hypothetical protein